MKIQHCELQSAVALFCNSLPFANVTVLCSHILSIPELQLAFFADY